MEMVCFKKVFKCLIINNKVLFYDLNFEGFNNSGALKEFLKKLDEEGSKDSDS